MLTVIRRARPKLRTGPLTSLIGVLPLLAACGSPPTDGNGTAKPGWGQPVVLADQAVFDSSVGVSLDGDGKGNAVAVWAPSTQVYAPILARRYSAREGWMAVETIAPIEGGSVNTPTVRMNASGDVVSIWDGYGGLRASTPGAGGSWDSPVLIGRPAALMWSWGLDDEGRALVVWLSGRSVLTSRLEPGFGWRQPAVVPGAEGQTSGLQTPTTGNVLVIYQSGHGLRRQRYLVGRGWQPPEPLEDVGGYDAVPLDDLGNGWVLWNERIDSDVVSVRSRRLTAGLPVGPVGEAAAPFAGYAWFRGTPLDTRGGMMAAWFQRVSQPDATERHALVANRFRVD